MAKSKKKKSPAQQIVKKTKPGFDLTPGHQNLIFIAVIAIYLIILLKPLVIDGLSPQGVDVVASKGLRNQIIEYKEKTGEDALWNPSIFSGMPIYQLLSPRVFSIDQVINLLSRFLSTPFMYHLLAAIGCFVLLRYLKIPPVISFLSGMIFILMPHYASLYLEGHFAKFRAVMYIPWILLAFLYFLDKRNMLSTATFALAFGLQVRTQHYQIVFYTALLVFAVGIQPLLKDLLEKEYQRFLKSVLFVLVAVLLGMGMAAQPLFLANEYLPYSKRGKTTINLKQPEKQANTSAESAGVTIEYATQWSTHPSELLTWVIPRFYGGMSGEKYDGSQVPALRNRTVPGYWGHMPFTQSYEYMGVVTLILAAIGIYGSRRNKFIIALICSALFFIVLAFGRHFLLFYEMFFNYFPYFNKFRAPVMSVTLTGFILAVFAAYGMNFLHQLGENDKKSDKKVVLWILAAFLALGVLIWLASLGFSYQKAGENYEPRIVQMLKTVRAEYLQQDLIRYFLLTIIAGGVIFAFIKNKVSRSLMAGVLVVLALIDLTNIQFRYDRDFVDTERLEKQYFRQNATDKFLLADKEIFRIMPPPQQMNGNRWAYHHQIIGGYTPIKMYAMEEIMENNLFTSWDQNFPINWNVLKMQNVKYLVMPQEITHPKLQLVLRDTEAQLYTYLYRERLPRGYIVGSYRLITDEYERLEFINQEAFDPAEIAILEENLNVEIARPDSAYAHLKNFTPNQLQFEVYSSEQALMVISESYYPPGWHIYLDDTKVPEIYKTNHALQSILVPEGNHTVELRFEPESFYRNVTYAAVASGIIYLTILLSLIMMYRNKFSTLLKKN